MVRYKIYKNEEVRIMGDLVTWMSDLFAVNLGTVGTTTVTLGLILSFSLVAGLVVSIYGRVKGR